VNGRRLPLRRPAGGRSDPGYRCAAATNDTLHWRRSTGLRRRPVRPPPRPVLDARAAHRL